jgi:hypothetical protein
MSENNAKEDKDFFDIDLAGVNLESYDFKNYDEIQIFMLTTTLSNPYTLVMFGVLSLFLKKIKEKYPDFKNKLRINFLLIHEIAKYKEMKPLFVPITKHYEIFIPDNLKKDALKRHISSIIELRFNEVKTLINMIMLNIVDEKDERLLTRDALLNFNYDDIFNRSAKISEYPDEVRDISDLKKPESSLLKKLFFEKVDDEKDELVKCLLKIFCHELAHTNEKNKSNAIFFIIDRWFKEIIEDLLEKSSESSKVIFEEIYKRLLYPIKDPKPEELDLYLNMISKYKVAGTKMDVEYFGQLLQKFSCNLFKEPFGGFYAEAIEKYKNYNDLMLIKKVRGTNRSQDIDIKNYEENFQQPFINIITKGFLTVQEEDILAQLIYIA